MKITLYLNVDRYGEAGVDTEAEHLERIQNYFDEDTSNYYSEGLDEYLTSRYSALELFQMTEEERSEALVNYREFYFKNFDTNYHWEKIVKEIEIGD